MKANAPEKIYIFENPVLDFTKLSVKQSDEDIEYTRTDAFIEKAAEWLMENVEKHISADGEYTVYYNEMVEDFKKVMML